MIIAIVCALACGSAVPTSKEPRAGDDVRYVDASIESGERLLGVSFVDVDGDGRVELCRALATKEGGRELAFHRFERSGLSSEPFRTVPILDEVLSYGFADVRDERGHELFLLTKTGAWSYSLEHEGFRGNLRRLIETELLYDVADPTELPEWRYVLPRSGGDWILLPGPNEYAVFGPAEDGTGVYGRMSRHDAIRTADAGFASSDAHGEVVIGEGGFKVDGGAPSRADLAAPFLAEAGSGGSFLSTQHEFRAPALVDVDGDGLLDLVTLEGDQLSVYSSRARANLPAGAAPSAPDRVEQVPGYLKPARSDRKHDRKSERRSERWHTGVELRFADLDGDGRVDVLAQLEEEGDSIENNEITLVVLLNDGTRLFPEEPDQVLRFEAADLRVHVTDVDGDGRPDLGIREFEVPSMLGAMTGVEFTLTNLLFLGQPGKRPFARKPAFKHAQRFDENSIQEAMVGREWKLDCDGDGIADVVEIDLEGRVSIRRLTRSKSFFGKARWALDETPWTRFEAAGNISSIDVRDINGDGLGDIVSQSARSLTLLLSARAGVAR